MSNASQRNFGAAARERARRQARLADGEEPFGLAQAAYLGPEWDAFYGSIHDQADAAREAGMGYQVNLSGLGRGPEDGGAGGGGLNAFDRDSLKALAINQLSDAASQQARAEMQHQQASLDAKEQGRIADLYRSYDDQSRAAAMAPPLEPTAVTLSADGRQLSTRPAGTPTEQMLARMNPIDRAKAQAALVDASLKSREMANKEAVTAETIRKDKATEAQSAPLAMPVDATGTPLGGDAVLRTLAPPIRNMVTAVLEGRQAMPTGTATKDPYWKRIIETAHAVDPNFDTIDYNARSKTRQDFTSGKAAGQINAINTAVGHLSDLAAEGKKLGNTGLDWVNWVYNKITPGGTDRGVAINNFETLKEGVGTELMRVWRQVGAGSEKEIEDWKSTISSTKSPEELAGAFKTISGMLESKLDSLDSQYKQGMGTDKVSAITPGSRRKLSAIETPDGAPARVNPFRK